MSQFGYPQIRQQLEGDQIHRLENVMTLHPEIHVLFEEMKLCFKAVENQVMFNVS